MSLSMFIMNDIIPDDLTVDQIHNEIDALRELIDDLEDRLYELEAGE